MNCMKILVGQFVYQDGIDLQVNLSENLCETREYNSGLTVVLVQGPNEYIIGLFKYSV